MSDAPKRTEAAQAGKTTGADPSVDRQELSETALGLIRGYGMDTALNAQDLHMKTATRTPEPNSPVVASG